MEKLKKLHLGCGEKYLEGYINIDYPQDHHSVMGVRADLYQDITKLKYEPGSIDEVRSHHVFEHFERARALALLLNWRSWLRERGRLVVETPDFYNSSLKYITSRSIKRRMELGRHIFGSEEAHWAIHYDFWDKRKFKYILGRLGFRKIRVKSYRNSFAKHYSHIPFSNLIGDILPKFIYQRYGGVKLPNILIECEKSGENIDETKIIPEILSMYLVGGEDNKMLDVWMSQFKDLRNE